MDWQRVWRRIDERRVSLGWSKADLFRSADISEPTYRKMKAGVPVVSDAKRRAITNALGWTPDSIDLILAGGEPVLDEPAADLVNQLAGEVATLAAVVREQANTIDRLRDDVTALQTAVRRAATSA